MQYDDLMKMLAFSPLLALGFVLLVRNPELALAILFNGTIIYFYLLYKLGLETNRLMTGGFYALLTLSSLAGGILLARKMPYKLKFGAIDFSVIWFFILIFISYIIFNTGSESTYKKITYIPFLVLLPYFSTHFLSSEKRLTRFFVYCVLIAAVLIIPSVYELFVTLAFSESARFSMFEFSGGINSPISYGITFAILLIIIGLWILEKEGFKAKYLILIIPSAYFMIRAGSRGALVSFIITWLFYISIIPKVRLQRKFLLIFFGAVLIVTTYWFIPEVTSDFYKTTFEYKYIPESSVSQRFDMWHEAVREFRTSPVWGVGFGNSVDGVGFPHNILLEVSAEFGIIGLLLFLYICYLILKESMDFIKRKENGNFNLLMKLSLLMFVYFLSEAMFSGYISNQTGLFLSIGLISCVIKAQESENKYANKNHTSGLKFLGLQHAKIQNSFLPSLTRSSRNSYVKAQNSKKERRTG